MEKINDNIQKECIKVYQNTGSYFIRLTVTPAYTYLRNIIESTERETSHYKTYIVPHKEDGKYVMLMVVVFHNPNVQLYNVASMDWEDYQLHYRGMRTGDKLLKTLSKIYTDTGLENVCIRISPSYYVENHSMFGDIRDNMIWLRTVPVKNQLGEDVEIGIIVKIEFDDTIDTYEVEEYIIEKPDENI